MRSDVRIYSGLFLIFLAAVAVIIITRAKTPHKPVTNFEQCAAAGYPVTHGLPPRQCTALGKIFVEQVVLWECGTSSDCPANQICADHACQPKK